jgi:hypothetical protein
MALKDVRVLVKGKFSDTSSQEHVEMDWLTKSEDIAMEFARKFASPKRGIRYTARGDWLWHQEITITMFSGDEVRAIPWFIPMKDSTPTRFSWNTNYAAH